ncbi:hypothetical protein H181DRAFT_01471 [Streptomyces sp. WMMB 714]|uniref:hypothetical protein n=1 Tax=Streptomyces sp. WMMB 714 TaxID=1286822 RepID=UPI000696B36A|nr:hypothetical protein [Streptomyces sp. WMMB 714]SCK20235.1 hypothetical protein H181DRAFT_01471 [Streptomyces sp. WMMB 714]
MLGGRDAEHGPSEGGEFAGIVGALWGSRGRPLLVTADVRRMRLRGTASMDIVGFIMIGIGAGLWNLAALDLLIGGGFRIGAGRRMRRGGPAPSFMTPLPATEKERTEVGDAGVLSGGFKVLTGAVMLGLMAVLASRDWHLWGETISVAGKSSSPGLEVLGLFVSASAFGALYFSIHTQREQHLPHRGAREWALQEPAAGSEVAQSRGKGLLLIAAGTLVCVASVTVSAFLTVRVFFTDPPPYVELVPLAVGASGPVYAFGLNVVRRGRRHLVRIVTDHGELERDSFILYLRWFKDDSLLDRAYPRIGSPLLLHFAISGASEEERLAEVLKPYGRLIAVGDPTVSLPRVGAERFYLPLEGWQDTVRELMSKARLVVLSLGTGEGTLWELVEAASVVAPERLILLVPMHEEEYEALRLEAHRRLQDRAGTLRAAGEDWTPPTLPPYRTDPRLRRSDMVEGYRAALRKTQDDSLMETAAEAWMSAMRFVKNDGARSGFKAVVHYPRAMPDGDWGEPVFSRLDSALLESPRKAFWRDPRYRALKLVLAPALRRAFGGPPAPPGGTHARASGARDRAKRSPEPPEPLAARLVLLCSFPLGFLVFGVWGPVQAAVLMLSAAVLYTWLTRKKPDVAERAEDEETTGS